MKVTVIKRFNDKENGFVLRKPGDALDVSDVRAAELIAKGFAEKPEPKIQENKK